MCHSGRNSGIGRAYPAAYLLDECQNMLFYGRQAHFGSVEKKFKAKEAPGRPENFPRFGGKSKDLWAEIKLFFQTRASIYVQQSMRSDPQSAKIRSIALRNENKILTIPKPHNPLKNPCFGQVVSFNFFDISSETFLESFLKKFLKLFFEICLRPTLS